MNIRTCAEHLLTYFAPEERSIPESVTYPGRHAAVAKALNDAMQELFGKGGAWVRKDERGHVLNAPTTVGIVVTNGSKLATISANDWKDWFAGCTIVIAGSAVDNQIRNDSREVVLKFPHDGETSTLVSSILTVDFSAGVSTSMTKGDNQNGRAYYSGITHTCQWTGAFWKIASIVTPANYFASATDCATPDLAESWTAHGDETGTLEITKTDTYTPTVAVVYQDSVSVDDDVLEVIKPVRLDRKPLMPYAQPYDMPDGARSTDDFGAHMHTDAGIYEVARISDTTGTPVAFAVETWSPGDTESPKLRVRLYPAPKLSAFLEYRCMLLPPVISDITSTSALPVPFGWIQSVFLPIAVKKLRGCSFWRGIVSDDEVNAAYKIALESLSDIKPKQTGGIRLVPRC